MSARRIAARRHPGIEPSKTKTPKAKHTMYGNETCTDDGSRSVLVGSRLLVDIFPRGLGSQPPPMDTAVRPFVKDVCLVEYICPIVTVAPRSQIDSCRYSCQCLPPRSGGAPAPPQSGGPLTGREGGWLKGGSPPRKF